MKKNNQNNEHEAEALETIKKHVDSWKDITEEDVEFKRMAGLSNVVLKASTKKEGVKPAKVIFRKFGKGGELVDRTRENKVIEKLSDLKLGAECLGYTDEYRVEVFFEGKQLHDCDTRIPEIRRKLAKNISILHSLDIDIEDKTPYLLKNLEEGIYDKEIEEKLKETKFNENEKKIIEEIREKLLSKEEREFLKSVFPQDPDSISFSHNDMHSGNIIYLKDEDKYIFIDVEYSSYNYRAFDIANIFIETMLDYQHEQSPYYKVKNHRKPNDDELDDFVRYYTFFDLFGEQVTDEETSKLLKNPKLLEEYANKCDRLDEYLEKVKQIMEECKVGELMSNYHWTLWSIMFSKSDDVKFNYISYAYDRMQLYQQAKAEMLAEFNKSKE